MYSSTATASFSCLRKFCRPIIYIIGERTENLSSDFPMKIHVSLSLKFSFVSREGTARSSSPQLLINSAFRGRLLRNVFLPSEFSPSSIIVRSTRYFFSSKVQIQELKNLLLSSFLLIKSDYTYNRKVFLLYKERNERRLEKILITN